MAEINISNISDISKPKFGTNCMICGQFIELDNLYSSKPQICEDCKETMQFIKQNRSAIEKMLKKSGGK